MHKWLHKNLGKGVTPAHLMNNINSKPFTIRTGHSSKVKMSMKKSIMPVSKSLSVLSISSSYVSHYHLVGDLRIQASSKTCMNLAILTTNVHSATNREKAPITIIRHSFLFLARSLASLTSILFHHSGLSLLHSSTQT